jgi:NAD(P)H-nitrite reductase large subunit
MLQDGEKGVILQRDKTTYAVAPHFPCGVVTPEQLRRVAEVAEKYGAAAIKLTSAERIAIVGLKESDIDAVWRDLGVKAGAAVGLCVRSVKACPGTTFCKRGQQDSLAIGMELDRLYHGTEVPGKLKIGVSGCANQCAETCIKDIGLVGKPKGWDLLVAGNGGARPRLAQKIAEGLTNDQALALVAKVMDAYRANAKKYERVGATIERIGMESFKTAVLKG